MAVRHELKSNMFPLLERLEFKIMHSLRFLSMLLLTLATAAHVSAQQPNDSAQQPNDSAQQPNIILMFVDDLGYGDLGCYGNQQHETPNIDRLAAEGQRWSSFYASGATCVPSRRGLMTGRHPSLICLLYTSPSPRD